jgi:hypothetical protein
MTNDTLSKAPVQPGQPDREETTDRCHELARTERGWERCHRDEHPSDGRHHVRDRSWLSTVSSPLLQLGQPCTGACHWPDQVQPYRGTAKGRHY